jgi:YegS/Rv2252/BmrU family lipid kinase
LSTLLAPQPKSPWWPGPAHYQPNRQDLQANQHGPALDPLRAGAALPAHFRLRVLVNPAAGSGAAKRRLPILHKLLRQHGFEPDVVCTEAPGHATQLALQAHRDGIDLLAVAGGDGTLSEVVQAYVGPQGHVQPGPALAVLPLGTGGDFCRSLGSPVGLSPAIAALGQGTLRPIDLIALRLHGHTPPLSRVFLNVAGPGIGGLSDEMVHAGPKWLGGRASYALAALRLLFTFEAPVLRVFTDDQLFFEGAVMSVCLANGQFLGGGMHIAPGAQLDDGQIDVVVVEARPMLPAAALTVPLFRGTHLAKPGMHIVLAQTVRIEHLGGGRAVLDVDGEAHLGLPATAQVLPAAVQWLQPQERVSI